MYQVNIVYYGYDAAKGAEPQTHQVDATSLYAAVKEFELFRDRQDLGASTTGDVIVVDKTTGNTVGHISYNGRLWDAHNSEKEINVMPTTTIDLFRRSGRDVEDISKIAGLDGLDLEGVAGRVYLDNAYIEKHDGEWLLTIYNESWSTSADGETLATLEQRLYDWCLEEMLID